MGVCVPLQPLTVVCEYMPRGDLNSCLHRFQAAGDSGEELTLSVDRLLEIASDICEAMIYLGYKSYVHRDLATRSCLVAMDWTAKLSDFSMCRLVDRSVDLVDTSVSALPVRWLPVESLIDGIFHFDTDVWSFGVFLWELFTFGAVPFENASVSDIIEGLRTGQRLSCPDGCRPAIYELMLRCWSNDRSQRPTFLQIKKTLSSLAAKPEMGCARSDSRSESSGLGLGIFFVNLRRLPSRGAEPLNVATVVRGPCWATVDEAPLAELNALIAVAVALEPMSGPEWRCTIEILQFVSGVNLLKLVSLDLETSSIRAPLPFRANDDLEVWDPGELTPIPWFASWMLTGACSTSVEAVSPMSDWREGFGSVGLLWESSRDMTLSTFAASRGSSSLAETFSSAFLTAHCALAVKAASSDRALSKLCARSGSLSWPATVLTAVLTKDCAFAARSTSDLARTGLWESHVASDGCVPLRGFSVLTELAADFFSITTTGSSRRLKSRIDRMLVSAKITKSSA
ncbi:unnamed protein product [Schistocephalus solidus]|uniref:Protein kinase domain-containing protein n=1 Tax=Schistocephalus solidus TaxID=70667 RepID=A0A183S772_SCHSO|nr:unnamed protein product [Schistocephalus solidus]